MKVPFLDIRKINMAYKSEFNAAFKQFLNSGNYILGDCVKQFEVNYATYQSSKYCLGVANGLDAITISLKSLNIGKGDEVIVPANTFIATLLAVSHVGATPILVEPNIDTYNIDTTKIEEKISKRTKAIIAVSLYGQAAELDKLNVICKKHNLYLIEDNAQAQGAYCKQKMTGTYGIISATSFYPGKNLGALGDAGAITTNDSSLYEFCKKYRNYGSSVKYIHDIIGINSRLDEIQALMLNIKLSNLNKEITARQNFADIYSTELQAIESLVLPKLAKNTTSVFHLYVVRTKDRYAFQSYLLKHGISTIIHYPVPPHLQKAYAHLKFKPGSFPITETIANTCLSLPMYGLLSESQLSYTIDIIKKYFKK